MEKRVQLSQIVGFVGRENTREALPTLAKENWVVFESEKMEVEQQTSLMSLVFGETANEATRANFCKLIKANEPEIAGLAQTILNPDIGLRDAIEVKQKDKQFLLVDGCRRFLAQTYAWITLGSPNEGDNIKATIVQDDDAACHTVSVVKNTQRRAMTPMEEARQYAYYRKTLGMKDGKIAELVGLTGSAGKQRVYIYRQLTRLNEKDQKAVENGKLGIVKALEKLRKKSEGEEGEGEGEGTGATEKGKKTFNLKKSKALYDNLDEVKRLAKDKGYDWQAVHYGMGLALGLVKVKEVHGPKDA